MKKRKLIEEMYSDDKLLFADGFDKAIIGIDDMDLKVVYDIDKCAEILMKRDGMSRDEAHEFLEFNTIGAYVGEKTPIWVRTYNV